MDEEDGSRAPLLSSAVLGQGIYLSNVRRSFGSTTVLHDINLHVERGSIYGLLGPSGCGKTTLLKVLLGRLYAHSGSVSVLGRPPHAAGHHVPGHWVGYAPQEIALYADLSIYETLRFYASMHQMSFDDFATRKQHLLHMLDLPDDSKIVRNLSGGQQRRVSLAVALLHAPELLILDEPTVGLDPLLRHRIWQHLRNLASAAGTTIIITTHYIEEARDADRIGLMRHGRILEEGSPESLLEKYELSSLEDVFLQVCRDAVRRKQEGETESVSSHSSSDAATQKKKKKVTFAADTALSDDRKGVNSSDYDLLLAKPPSLLTNGSTFKKRCFQIGGTSRRQFTQIIRNFRLLAWEILVPTVQIIIFMLAIGGDVKNVSLVVVNNDVGYAVPFFGRINLGALYLQDLQQNHSATLNVITNVTLDDGLAMVRRGQAWGVLVIPSNLTSTSFGFLGSNQTCGDLIESTDGSFLNATQLQIYLDLSNTQVSITLIQQLGNAFEDLCIKYFGQALTPLKLMPPIYGSLDSKFSDFLAPGVITVIAFAQSISVTAMSFIKVRTVTNEVQNIQQKFLYLNVNLGRIQERTNGSMDRIYASGVPASVLIAANFLTHSLILVLQVGIMVIVALYVFHVQLVGNLAYVFTLLICLGVVGQSFGMFVSASVREESEAIQMVLAIFFPTLLLSGIIWPLEAIPNWFSWVSKGLPTTWVAAAMRSVMLRGWGIDMQSVWLGYVVCAAWATLFLTVAGIQLASVDFSFRRICCRRKSD